MKSGYVDSPAGELFYEISGSGDGAPLVCIHGGPGFCSYYLAPLHALADLLPVVLYDQAGCGRARRGGPRKLFSVEGFVLELEALRCALGVETLHLFGHSFGGVVAGEYALRYPERVKSIIFGSVSIDIPRWISDSQRLLAQLSLMDRMILREGERTGITNSPEYARALAAYYRRFVYGFDEKPETITQSERESDTQTYATVWGANELLANGACKSYSLTPRLAEITCPTLFVCGRYDEATPEAHEFFASQCPRSALRIFENSAHHPHITDEEAFLARLREFFTTDQH